MNPPIMARWNLALRFGLELAALAGIGAAAWELASGQMRWLAAVTAPSIVLLSWGVFNVPDDPSRSGRAPVAVTGVTRLALELVILFGGALGCAFAIDQVVGSAVLILIVVHYVASAARVRWLLERS